MIDFFKNRSWEDYVVIAVFSIVIIGVLMFAIGFFWGIDVEVVPGFETKTSVYGVLFKENPTLSQAGLDNSNLFNLVGSIDKRISGFDVLYAMTVVSITGFSIIMFGILTIILLVVGSILYDVYLAKFKDKSE